MAIKQIKRHRWQRQMHLAGAGLKAGLGWAGDQFRILGLPAGEREQARQQLMAEQAEAWVRSLGELKGSIVKIGQIVATYADYCLPPPLAAALHLLEAETEPLAWRVMAPVIADALAGREQQLIIEPVPLAAASLSQVHRARVKADQRSLCLKVLYPGIAETVDSDLAVLGTGLQWWLQKDERDRFAQWLEAISTVLREELDLQREAGNLHRWQQRLADDIRYLVPQVADEFCANGILAMTYESGVVQHDEAVLALPQERRNRLAVNMLELFLREVLVWGEMQTDPHPGNYRIRLDAGDGDRIVLLDFGSVREISAALLAPLRQMMLSAYRMDRDGLLDGMMALGLLDSSAPDSVSQAFADVLMGLTEPLNYRQRLAADRDSVPANAVDEEGNYCWAAARLPKRMGKQALQSAFSQHFRFPGADFLLLSRKLAGVYAFIAAMDARFDAAPVMEKVISEMAAAQSSS